MKRVGIAVVAVAVGLAACHSSSETAVDPNMDMPRRSLAEARASLPAPSAERAFVFDGAAVEHGEIIRSLRLAVEPGEFHGEAAWYVAEESEERRGADQPISTETTTAWFSADLRVLDRKSGRQLASPEHDAHGDATWTLAGALIFLRECPAEVAAYVDERPRDQPGYCVQVSQVDADGAIHASAPTVDAYLVHVVLRGPNRDVVEIGRSLGWHFMGKIVARDPGR